MNEYTLLSSGWIRGWATLIAGGCYLDNGLREDFTALHNPWVLWWVYVGPYLRNVYNDATQCNIIAPILKQRSFKMVQTCVFFENRFLRLLSGTLRLACGRLGPRKQKSQNQKILYLQTSALTQPRTSPSEFRSQISQITELDHISSHIRWNDVRHLPLD